MKKLLSTFLYLFALQTAIAQTLSPIIVKHNGIHYERLAQLDTLLNQYEEKNWLVGAVVIIVKDNYVEKIMNIIYGSLK